MFLDSLRPGLERFDPGETVVTQKLAEGSGKTTGPGHDRMDVATGRLASRQRS